MEVTNKVIKHQKSQMTSVTDNVMLMKDVYRFVRVTGRG